MYARFSLGQQLPTLSKRFIMVDDDIFIMPQHAHATFNNESLATLSTRLFFDNSGLPIQPWPVHGSHRPMPMLRDAYVAATKATPLDDVAKVLRSDRADGESRFQIDYLERWVHRMSLEGTSRTFSTSGLNIGISGSWTMERSIKRLTKQADRPSGHYVALQWHWATSNLKPFDAFLRNVEHYRPLFVVVNDDWPQQDTAERASKALRAFLERFYARPAPWELE